MNKLLYILILAIPLMSLAQSPVTELGVMTMGSFNQQLSAMNAAVTQQNSSFISKLGDELIKDSDFIAKMTTVRKTIDDVNENIEDLYKLKQNVEKAYYTFEKFDKFSYSDFAYGFEQYTGVNVEPAKMLPRIPETQKMRNDLSRYDTKHSQLKVLDKTFYGVHSTFTLLKNTFTDSEDFRDYLRKSPDELEDFEKQMMFAELLQKSYEDSMLVRDIQTATYFFTLSDSLLGVSYEMQKSFQQEDLFRMTDGDRIRSLNNCTKIQLQALRLRTQAQMLYDNAYLTLQEKYKQETTHSLKSYNATESFKSYTKRLYN